MSTVGLACAARGFPSRVRWSSHATNVLFAKVVDDAALVHKRVHLVRGKLVIEKDKARSKMYWVDDGVFHCPKPSVAVDIVLLVQPGLRRVQERNGVGISALFTSVLLSGRSEVSER
jgi:hypothetical protein